MKSMKISIITVVKDGVKEIAETIGSISYQKKKYALDLEWIVIDGVSSDGTLELLNNNKDIIDIYISEKDAGIYDAMNKGLSLATGNGVLFLNAGDLLVGDVLEGVTRAPIYLPVFYTDIFGRFKKVRIGSKREGIPNCHQGIIFPRTELRYSLDYKICSDYDFFLRHCFVDAIDLHKTSGYVIFSPGISSISYKERDREIFNIRRIYFGFLSAILYEWRNFLKRIVRSFIFK